MEFKYNKIEKKNKIEMTPQIEHSRWSILRTVIVDRPTSEQ